MKAALGILGSRFTVLQGMIQHKQYQLNSLIRVHDTRMDAAALMHELSTLEAQLGEVRYAIKVIKTGDSHTPVPKTED